MYVCVHISYIQTLDSTHMVNLTSVMVRHRQLIVCFRIWFYICMYILCTERFKYAGKNYSLLWSILLTVISPIINELKAKKNQHILKMKPWFEPLKWSCKHSYTYYSLIVLFIQCLAFCVMYTYHTYIIYLFLWPMLQFWPYLQGKYDN